MKPRSSGATTTCHRARRGRRRPRSRRQRHACSASSSADAAGRALAVGGDDDAVAVADAGRAAGATRRVAVADHRVPADGARPSRRPGPRARCVTDPRPARRCARSRRSKAGAGGATAVVARAPRRGQRCGQVGLLGEDLGGPVAHAPGLDQQRPGRRRRGGRTATCSPSVEPRQPRLHAVEDQALGQPLPLLAAPRLVADELRRPARAPRRWAAARGTGRSRRARRRRSSAGRRRRTR